MTRTTLCCRIVATRCNSRSSRRCGAAVAAISANFETSDDDVKSAVALDLSLEAIEEIAFEFGDLATAKASHMDVIALGATFVVMFFALEVHEVELVDQAVALEEIESAIDGDAVDLGIQFAGFAEDLGGVEVLFGGLDDAQDGA